MIGICGVGLFTYLTFMRQIDDLRAWRKQAIEAHMYETAELVGDKVFAWSSHPDDAYWLAQTYYGMGEYVRGAALILDHRFEHESPRCRYIAALCLLQAQHLERALALLTAEYTVSSRVTSQSFPPPSQSQPANHNQTPTHQVFGHPGGSRQDPSNQEPFRQGSSRQVSSRQASSHQWGHHGGVQGGVQGSVQGIPHVGPASAASGTAAGGPTQNKIRVISTSSMKAPGAPGVRTVSGGSRMSMILSGVDEDSLPEPLGQGELDELNGVYVDALLQFVLGRVYTLQAKFGLAKEAYIAALRIDPRCFDALAQLVKYHALTPKEEAALMDTLDFSSAGGDLGHSLYMLRLTPTTTGAAHLDSALAMLEEAYMIPDHLSDVTIAQANQLLAEGRFDSARSLLETCLREDPHNLRAHTPFAACLYELGDANMLYKVAHELADIAPGSAVSSYAIGLYYLATHRIPEARAHFSNASMVDPGNAPAWLGFASTFSEECEHEQAITAYSNIARLFPGYYLPYLCIGIQHMQLSNLNLAEKYLATAADFFEEDPLIMNELGVVFYHQDRPERALQILEYAAEILEHFHGNDKTRLSITANTAYVLRRLGRVTEALALFEQVCAGGPLDASVLSAMGLCLLQLDDPDAACEKLALALALAPDDTVTNDLMKRAVESAAKAFDPAKFAVQRQKIAFDT